MKKILSLLSILTLLALVACDSQSDNLYRPSEAPEAFEEQEQSAEFQKITFNPSVDILFVIDDSHSMKEVINNLGVNINRFVDAFAQYEQIDFHIGVTTIWDSRRYNRPRSDHEDGWVPQFQDDGTRNFWSLGELIPVAGKSEGDLRFVQREDGFVDLLKSTLHSIQPQPWVEGNSTTPGVGPQFEELFSPVLANLQSRNNNHGLFSANRDFWRTQSHKVFVFITDADDGTPNIDERAFDRQVQDLIDGNAKDDYSYYAVMNTPEGGCQMDYDYRGKDTTKFRLTNLLSYTRGTALNICKAFGDKLADIGGEIRERTLGKVVIPLKQYPEFYTENPDGEDKEWMEIKYGDTKIPVLNEQGFGWTWDPNDNVIIIRGIEQLEHQEGAEFSVDFTAYRL